MTKLLTTLFFVASVPVVQAQTMDLVFFSDDGTEFIVLVDGDLKNETPATRVIAKGIRTETPVIILRFKDPSIPQLRKNWYSELGMEYTVMVTTNKKGERVLRPSGEAALGTATFSNTPDPAGFVEDASDQRTTETETRPTSARSVDQRKSTISTEQYVAQPDRVDMSIGMDASGVQMGVQVIDGVQSITTSTTTTTTTTTTIHDDAHDHVVIDPGSAPAVYDMPGYTGIIGCPWPLSATEYQDAKVGISAKSFEDSRMTVAKQVASDRCLTAEQVKGIMSLFSFEESKLDFAKFAYDHTYDLSNYYKVNSAFTFDSSTKELDDYLRSR